MPVFPRRKRGARARERERARARPTYANHPAPVRIPRGVARHAVKALRTGVIRAGLPVVDLAFKVLRMVALGDGEVVSAAVHKFYVAG